MNLVLFEADEIGQALALSDERSKHILQVLRRGPGDEFDAGLIDGPRGKATVLAIDEQSIRLVFRWVEEPPPLAKMTLVIGMPRPQTARKLLEEATAMGVAAMHFVTTEKSDPGYAQSRLWSTGEWRRHVVAGAAQAFTTRLPAVSFDDTLAGALGRCSDACALALDNYEASRRLGAIEVSLPLTLAIGPERGWSDGERMLLRGHGFELAHLGERVLRVETACVAALALVRARLGLM